MNAIYLFDSIAKMMFELDGQFPVDATIEDRERWYERLFNLFEYYAFSVNHSHLDGDMAQYYLTGIKECAKRIKKCYPNLLKRLTTLPEGQLNELRKYYKTMTDKDLFD
jgi:hypothetical protein